MIRILRDEELEALDGEHEALPILALELLDGHPLPMLAFAAVAAHVAVEGGDRLAVGATDRIRCLAPAVDRLPSKAGWRGMGQDGMGDERLGMDQQQLLLREAEATGMADGHAQS